MTPHSPGTGQINTLIWIGFFAALIVVLAINLGLFKAIRRNRGGRGRVATQRRGAVGLQWRVTGALSGFAVVLFVLAIIFTSNATSEPKTTSAGLTSYHGEPLEGPLVIKTTGQQWIWRYNYPNGAFSYYKLVIPAHTEIKLKLTSTDVIHTWNVPDLTPKVEAVPGKETAVYFRADAEGEFWGQSSTLSGQAYAPMRIAVEVVSPERFEEFIAQQAKEIREGDQSAAKIATEKAKEEEKFEGGETAEEGPGEGKRTTRRRWRRRRRRRPGIRRRRRRIRRSRRRRSHGRRRRRRNRRSGRRPERRSGQRSLQRKLLGLPRRRWPRRQRRP